MIKSLVESRSRARTPASALDKGTQSFLRQTFLLPWPPTANALWRAYRGQNILSAVARAWARQAEMALMLQKPKPVKGPVALSIRLGSPTGRRFDPDNRVKAPIDLLKRMGVIEDDDDSIVKHLTVEPCADMTGVEISVRPFAIAAAKQKEAA